ncbi:hypothetical protein RHSIM_Rhsim02G0219200 [Rhododendron simsii]|uniref:Uncharacterized protein n=1 Tax=Rhododendron simsii TaxID=118357 RepID=A0A834HLN0_RHOSS|nr:hypothetical protein RHSIM_Rhsim02G0219200 [Rhododendron simsii]
MMNEIEDVGRRLKDACLSGSVAALEALIEEDELILDRVSSLIGFFINDSTPLHVAALRGHLDFAKALLTRKAKLATELNSKRSLPLYLACTEGHLEIVEELLRVNTNVCIGRDQDGILMLYFFQFLLVAYRTILVFSRMTTEEEEDIVVLLGSIFEDKCSVIGLVVSTSRTSGLLACFTLPEESGIQCIQRLLKTIDIGGYIVLLLPRRVWLKELRQEMEAGRIWRVGPTAKSGVWVEDLRPDFSLKPDMERQPPPHRWASGTTAWW